MGNGRNDMKKEQGALAAVAIGPAGAAMKGIATVANAGIITNLNAQIDANESERKRLSRGVGRFTNRDEIRALDEKNEDLIEKRNKRTK